MYEDYDLDDRCSEFDTMEFTDGKHFERYCAELLLKDDFTDVQLTGHTDHGVDILARKNRLLYAFQCKCYTKNVSRAAVEQIYTGKDLYKADVGVILSNADLTKTAYKDAARLGIEVWGRFYLGLLSAK